MGLVLLFTKELLPASQSWVHLICASTGALQSLSQARVCHHEESAVVKALVLPTSHLLCPLLPSLLEDTQQEADGV